MICISDILIQKWKKLSLGHFYILKSSDPLPKAEDVFKNWIMDFSTSILEEELGLPTEKASLKAKSGHPDVLTIRPADQGKNSDSNKKYSSQDFENFFRFLTLKNFELSHRFVFIADIHLLTESLCNKLLKTLEEPPKQTSIFFLESSPASLPQTITGRAIKIKLPLSKESKQTSHSFFRNIADSHLYFIDLLKKESIDDKLISLIKEYLETKQKTFEIIKFLQTNSKLQEKILKLIISWQANILSSFEQKNLLLEQISWFSKSQSFHNNSTERLYSILEVLHPF